MLDPISLLVVTTGSAIMGMAVLGSLLRSNVPGVRRWFAASVLALGALLLFALRGRIDDVLSILVANAGLSMALMQVLLGVREFVGRPPHRWHEYLAWLAMIAALAFWTYVTPDIDLRIAVVSAYHGYLYASLAWLVLRAPPYGRSRYAYRFVAVTTVVGAAGNIAKCVMFGLGLYGQADIGEHSVVGLVFLVLGNLAVPCLAVGMVLLAHDRLTSRLERLANLDELTGIMGRRAFLVQAEARLRASSRSARPLSLAIVDIDYFKRINDSYGHAAGDQVLVHFTAVIARHLRAGDCFGRLGGEEFAVLCPDTELEAAAALLNRLRGVLVQAASPIESLPNAVTFSAGVDQFRPGETLAALMARADAALYAAKAMGRDRVVAVPCDDAVQEPELGARLAPLEARRASN